MIASSVYQAVINTLERNPTLKDYVKYVFKGVRYDLEPASFPCLMIEPVSDNEVLQTYNDSIEDVLLGLNIYGLTYNASEPDKSIAGNEDYKGVLEFSNDVVACLQSSYQLGCHSYDIKFQTTAFDTVDLINGKYPVRGFRMPIKVQYRRTNGA
jgi:hypothetical protein